MSEIRCLGVLGGEAEEIYHQARRKPLNSKADAYMVFFLGSLTEEGLLGEQGFVLLDTTVKVNPFLPEWSGSLFVFQGEYNTFLARPASQIRVVENGFSHEWFFELKDCSVVGLVVAVVPSDVGVWPLGIETSGDDVKKSMAGAGVSGHGLTSGVVEGSASGEVLGYSEEEEGQWHGSLRA